MAFGLGPFGLGPFGVGLLYSARGGGALLGPLMMRRHATHPARLHVVPAGSMAVFGIGYLALAVAPAFWLVLLLLVVAHAGGGANWILSTYRLHATVPDRLRGRVSSADATLATLATLVIAGSQVAFGLLSEVLPARELLALAGLLVLLYSGAWWLGTRAARLPLTTGPA